MSQSLVRPQGPHKILLINEEWAAEETEAQSSPPALKPHGQSQWLLLSLRPSHCTL